MISTTDLTAAQLLQLDALLAETTTGCVHYRPPVVRDVDALQDLECAELVRWTHDCGYEITDNGRALVVERAQDAADGEGFLREADDDLLRKAIEKLKAVFNDLTDPPLRERTLVDIEACQNALDERGDRAEGRTESTGRHRVVPADDRPTETIDRVELPTEPLPLIGTLPSIPVAEILTDRDGAERLLVAIQDMPGPADIVEFLAEQHTADEWAALEADLGDESGWWRRNLTPRRVLALSVIASIVGTWFVAWLVMA